MSPDAEILIVGSGPAGISAAWPLVEAGISVLMVDASAGTLPALPLHENIDAFRRDPDRIDYELAPDSALPADSASPKLATPLARALLSGFSEAVGLSASGFLPTGAHAAGGLSRIWGALAMPWDAGDLTEFPDRAGLMQAYGRVASRVGISRMGDGGMVLAEPARRVLSRHRAMAGERDFVLEPASNAVLTSSRADRQACNTCGLCLHGCSRGAIYDSALELPALQAFANFSYRPGILVRRLANEGGLHVAEAVCGGRPVRLLAGRIILAAGTIATTSLALRRIGLTGHAVRLHSNPVGGAAFVVPSKIGMALPERSFALGQLFYRAQLRNGATSVGVLYGADTLPLGSLAERMPLRGPAAMRLTRALAPGLLVASGYLPGHFSKNHITVDDVDGEGRVTISGEQTAEAARLLRESFARLSRAMRRRGAWALPGSVSILQPGADAHAAATLPMGGVGRNATGPLGELRGCDGIHIADGASLPTLAATHPTLTIMANADRIGWNLAARILAERVPARRPATCKA